MSDEQKLVSIVVPFLNEEENLPLLYDRVSAVFEGRPEDLEFVFVDDGSTDSSLQRLAEIRARDPRVGILQLSRNFGHQIAITAGLDYAAGDAVIIMDADLQDPPEVIPDLLDKWYAGYEVVSAVRKSREGETWLKKFLAASFYRLFRLLVKFEVPMNAGDFRLVDRSVVSALKDVREAHRFMRGLTCWVGYRQCVTYYDRQERHAGKTKYPVWNSLRLAFDGITSFSASPLRWMTFAGVFVAFCGILKGLHIMVRRIWFPEGFVAGWASLVAMILFFSGIQLLCLGVVGQYVGRIFEESKKRPLYFVKATQGLDRRV